MKFRDTLVAIFVAALIPAAGLRLTWHWREQANRLRCADNLRRLGQALQVYANSNKGRFRATTYVANGEPVPTAYTGVAVSALAPDGPQPNDVTGGLYLLVRDGSLTPDVFVCPSDAAATPWDFGGRSAAAFANFPGREHLSYGYDNPYHGAAFLAQARNMGLWCGLSSDHPVAADMGPPVPPGGTPPVMTRAEMLASNSPNHFGAGQNVLFSDVHVDWSRTVYAGELNAPGGLRDHIYAYGPDLPGRRNANTCGPPQDRRDAVLLPLSDFHPPPPTAVRP